MFNLEILKLICGGCLILNNKFHYYPKVGYVLSFIRIMLLEVELPIHLLTYLGVVKTYTSYNTITFDGPRGTPRVLVPGAVARGPSPLVHFRFFSRIYGSIGVSSTCPGVGVIKWRHNLGKMLIDYSSRRG